MKKILFCIFILYFFLIVSGSIFAVGERVVSLGGANSWNLAENRQSVTEVRQLRPYPVLVLASSAVSQIAGYSAAAGVLGNFAPLSESVLDLSVSFDERETGLFRDAAGNYRLMTPPDIESVDRTFARVGLGAALFGRSGAFSNMGPVVVHPQSRGALFSPGSRVRDFTIEFWIYPQNMENGEQIFSWMSTKTINGNQSVQRITCTASRNRLRWSFANFFTSANNSAHIDIDFSGSGVVVPKRWSHHLIRFDANTGLLEYIVDGSSEAIVYATASGRESSEVYTPVIGANGSFLLGERFVGMMDEFKIHSAFVQRSSINRYTNAGGRMETRAIDLGENASGVLRINAAGGRTYTGTVSGSAPRNEFRENGRFRFSDNCEMNFFIRASENPYLLNANKWVNFVPGEEVTGVSGRYVQIAVDFYPSGDGESSPYLENLQIVFMPGEPPMPPHNLTAAALDGAVQLRWRHSPSPNAVGYYVYYSSVRGEFFGGDAASGPSPINVGRTNNIVIDGLRNGSLYYFRVAAYDLLTGEVTRNVGEFSAEVTARPLAGLSQ